MSLDIIKEMCHKNFFSPAEEDVISKEAVNIEKYQIRLKNPFLNFYE